MSQERWRVSDGAQRKFAPPSVYDQDDDDIVERASLTKMVGVAVTFLFSLLFGVAIVSLLVYNIVNALGVSISWNNALVLSVCVMLLRYFDLGIVSSLRKRNRD